MTRRSARRAALTAPLLMAAGCNPPLAEPELYSKTPPPSQAPAATAPAAAAAPAAPAPDLREASATIVPGTDRPEQPTRVSVTGGQPRGGDVSLNFVAADVTAVAKAVLGDILKVQYSVAPGVTGQVTLTTTAPVARTEVLGLFDQALRNANLALVVEDKGYAILLLEAARSRAPLDEGATLPGFATETLRLQFISASEFEALLKPVLPGVVVRADAARNSIVISGSAGQRAAARDLVKQFDVNWLRNTSFALFVPQRTDSRLITSELEKMLNAPGAPTRGLVRLIAMEQLNGILAISGQRQYLDDVRRWVEILDREGQNNEPRLFVYRVQNGRAADLAKVLVAAFGEDGGSEGGNGSDADANVDFSDGSTPVRLNARRAAQAAAAAGEDGATPPPAQQGAAGGKEAVAVTSKTLDARITSDETNNAIVVYTRPRNYAIIEDALRKLDVLPFQVMIEAAIAEVTLNDDLRYGVQWLFEGVGNWEFAQTAGQTRNPTREFPGLSILYAKPGSITATLNALEELTNVNVVSAPKLLVLNNQTASLQVGDQVPIAVGSAVSVQDPDAPIVNSIEYRDTGIILKITPRVNANGLVLLDVAQEVSDVVETDTSDIDSPTISTRRVASSVAVQDGETLALGGLIRNNITKGRSGIPVLSRIPVFGALFGVQSATDVRTELLILIRPRVIRSVDEGRAITEELRSKLQALEPGLRRAQIP